jgi:signal transduction histidine kinase
MSERIVWRHDPGPDSESPSMAMARRLHDDVVQRLCGVAAALSSTRPIAASDQERCKVELEAAIAELRAVIGEAVAPAEMTAQVALATAVGEACVRSGEARVELRSEGDAEVPRAVAAFAHDFTAEAIRNAVNHADPTSISVSVVVRDDQASVEVRNDGVRTAGDTSGTQLGLALLAADAGRYGGRVDARREGPDGWRAALRVWLVPPSPRTRRFARGLPDRRPAA